MQDYDATLKLLLRQAARRAIQELSGVAIAAWLDVELPKIQNLRMDLLGEDADGNLHHFELQSTNDRQIDLRMADYAVGVKRLTGKFPRQLVIYVGEAPLTMPSELRGPKVLISYEVIDIRELDGDKLLVSEDVGDNVIAILTRLRDDKEAIRTIVSRIAKRPESERSTAVQQLVILAGLRRRLGRTVKEEVEKMPIVIDIMENEIIGPAIRKGLAEGLEKGLAQGLEKGRAEGLEKGLEKGREEGREEGLEKGLEKGRTEGELRMLRRQIEKRFGPIPDWADALLASLSVTEIEVLGDRILDAPTLKSLLQ